MAYTILTKKYAEATFCLPLTADGTAFLLCKPVLATRIHDITTHAIAEAGFDSHIAAQRIVERLFTESVVGWKGVNDINGEPVQFSKEVLLEVCNSDPEFVNTQLDRIRRIAREARLEEEKN